MVGWLLVLELVDKILNQQKVSMVFPVIPQNCSSLTSTICGVFHNALLTIQLQSWVVFYISWLEQRRTIVGKGPFKQKPFTFPRIVPIVQESLPVYECLHWITIYQDVSRKSFSHYLITYPSLLHNLPNGLEAVVRPGPDIIPLFNLD